MVQSRTTLFTETSQSSDYSNLKTEYSVAATAVSSFATDGNYSTCSATAGGEITAWWVALVAVMFDTISVDVSLKSLPGVYDATPYHNNDVIMGVIASQITSLTIVYATVYSDTDQRKYQSSASLAFVRGIHRGPVNSPHKWPVTRKLFPFDDVIMIMPDATSDLPVTEGNTYTSTYIYI